MKRVWEQYRLGIVLGGLLVLALAAAAVLAGSGSRGVLAPTGYDPDGAHALAVLL